MMHTFAKCVWLAPMMSAWYTTGALLSAAKAMSLFSMGTASSSVPPKGALDRNGIQLFGTEPCVVAGAVCGLQIA